MPARPEPADSKWADLRDAQRLTALNLPNTGLAVAIDIGDEKNIHPTNKQEVGRRLALAAEAKTYGKEIVFSGPAFDTAKFDGATVRIAFKPGTAKGLTTSIKGPVTIQEPIKGFAIAGEDHKFVWAKAKIFPATTTTKPLQDSVILTAEGVEKPVAVRYAWANSPSVNLVNKAGLPAVPFRTDDWPQVEPPPIPAATPTPTATPAPK